MCGHQFIQTIGLVQLPETIIDDGLTHAVFQFAKLLLELGSTVFVIIAGVYFNQFYDPEESLRITIHRNLYAFTLLYRLNDR